MAGGYREGSGISKHGYYKGIYCGSTYELCWVIYNLDHQVPFSRFPGKLEKDGLTYYPDFLLSDGKTIVEIKGYEKKESVDKKTNVAESFGYIVKVLRKEDLRHAFDYVANTYGTKNYFELYDGYKPKYKHICDYCETEFETDRKIKTQTKFCSRTCAGKYQKSMNQMTDDMKQRISQTLKGKKVKPYTRKFKQVWITDGKVNTRIKANAEIPVGFRRGRTVSH